MSAPVESPALADPASDHTPPSGAPLLFSSQSVLHWHWLAVGVFVLSSTLNYLDRQLLAALAPTIRSEFHLTNAQYGILLSLFSFLYTAATPPAGLLLDRIGLNRGSALAVFVWSLAGACTGLAQSFFGLLTCRGLLGISQAAGIPAAGKAIANYLQPRELAIGRALNTLGVNLGSIAAPLAVALIAPRFGWRVAFLLCGALGLVWIPLWLLTAHRLPDHNTSRDSSAAPLKQLLSDRRLWGVALATALIMAIHTLWINWTTLFFVESHHLTQNEANRQFAWIPPFCAALGGLFGGFLSFHWISRGMTVLAARRRIAWIVGPLALLTAAVPFIPSAPWAVVVISLSFFACTAITTNLNVVPIDLFGLRHAAFSIAIVNCSYGLMQALLSPAIGYGVDHFGFALVCPVITLIAITGFLALFAMVR